MSKKFSVLVLGANGMLGKEIVDFLRNKELIKSVKGVDFPEVDVTAPLKAENSLESYTKNVLGFSTHYDIVVNCAAITDTKGIEGDLKDKSYAVNARALLNISEYCSRHNARLIHISTDYVFSEKGLKNGKEKPFEEFDKPFPVNTYGLHKLLGEQFIMTTLEQEDYAILRVSWLVGICNSKSFVHKFLKNCLKIAKMNGNCVGGTENEYSVPTFCSNVCQQIYNVITYGLQGIFHCCDDSDGEKISRYRFASDILKYYKKYSDKNEITEKIGGVAPVVMDEKGVMKYPKYSVMRKSEGLVSENTWEYPASLEIFIKDNIKTINAWLFNGLD